VRAEREAVAALLADDVRIARPTRKNVAGTRLVVR
jgi:hypothetical protein